MPIYSQNPTADARVWDGHTGTNYGSLSYLNMGEFGDGEKCEIFLKFDLSVFRPGFTINSAKLRIYQYDDDNDWLSPTIETACELCGAAWTESGITWGNKPANAASTPQALKSFDNKISSYVEYNVKSHIEGIVDGTFANHGFRLRYTGTSSETMKYFRSSEYGTVSKRPVLIIDYIDLPNPTAPTISPVSTIKTASKTFTFGESTDPIFASSELYYEMAISFNNGAAWDDTITTSTQGIALCSIDIKSANFLNIVAGRYYYNTQCKIKVRAKTPLYNGVTYYSDWVESSAFTIDYRITPGAPSSLSVSDSEPYEGEAITFTCGRPATYNTHDDDGNTNNLTYYAQLSNGTALANAAEPVTSASKIVPYTVGNLTSGVSDLSTYIRAYCKDMENQSGAFCANVPITIKRFRTPIINVSSIDRAETTATVNISVLDTGYGGVQASSQINKVQYSLNGAAYADATLGAWSGLNNSFEISGLAAGTAYSLSVKVINNAPGGTALSNKTSTAYAINILAYTPGWFADENGSCQKALYVGENYSASVDPGCGKIQNDFEVGGTLTQNSEEVATKAYADTKPAGQGFQFYDVDGHLYTFRTGGSAGNGALFLLKDNSLSTPFLRFDYATRNVAIGSGGYNTGHLTLGSYHIWPDASGKLRIKNGTPASDTDGTIIGTQS